MSRLEARLNKLSGKEDRLSNKFEGSPAQVALGPLSIRIELDFKNSVTKRIAWRPGFQELASRFLQELRQEASLGGQDSAAALFIDYNGSVSNMIAGIAWTHLEDFTLSRP